MGELTPEAKAEIAEAIRIVREDKFTQYVRTTLEKHVPKPTNDPPNDPPKDPPTDPNAPPPPPIDPPNDPPKPKKSGIWWPNTEDES